MMDEEIWKDVDGYKGLYQVSTHGRIKSMERNIKSHGKCTRFSPEKIKKTKTNNPYPVAQLYKNRVKKCLVVHRLVAKAFIPNPENKREVNHKDGNKENNHWTNLEWCTPSENSTHAVKNKLRIAAKGEKARSAKLTEGQVIEIRRLINQGVSQRKIASMFGVNQPSIGDINRRITWKHI